MYGEEQVKREIEKAFVTQYVDLVLEYGKKFLGRDVSTILELGCGTGWITEEFRARGVDIVGIEGSTHAVNWASAFRHVSVIQHDLRRPLDLDRTFDLVVCTETAEHLECPFSSVLVDTMTKHSNLVWFSSDGKSMAEAHYAHMNEQPITFWQHLFKFFGYHMFFLPNDVQKFWKDSEGTRAMFYSDQITSPEELRQPDLPDEVKSLGYAII
jgi:2-polyprenyl-3-methyl-5-hydroxy-6-metoxy-1,4-benzoquinol methylase